MLRKSARGSAEHAPGGKNTGMRRDNGCLDTQVPAKAGGERRSGTAADNKNRIAWIMAALHCHQLQGVDHAGMRDVDNGDCRILDAHAERGGDGGDRVGSLLFVQMHAAAGKRRRIEDADSQNGI